MNKKYWQNFSELRDSEASKKISEDEFRETLPFEISGELTKAPTQRRDFLKYLGFSTTAAMIAASCEMPVRKAIPFANNRKILFLELPTIMPLLMYRMEMQ